MIRCLVFSGLLLGASCSVFAADIYQWTDESGRLHVSDRPPAKGAARKIESRTPELTAEQRQQAASTALQDKAKLERSTPAAGATASAPVPSEVLPPASLSGVPAKETECERMTRLYRESEACFGPYKLWNGTTKAEAFERCKVAVEPSIQCGYVKQ